MLLALTALSLTACSGMPEPKDAASLGVAAADHALDFVSRNVRADDAPAHARVARVRGALETVSAYVEGKASTVEGAAALADALSLARVAVEELEADGVKVPAEVKAALAAALSLVAE
jgi:hypothetical protein